MAFQRPRQKPWPRDTAFGRRLRLRHDYQQWLLHTTDSKVEGSSSLNPPLPQRDTALESSNERDVPSPPPNTPRTSTASARAWHVVELDRLINRLRYGNSDDDYSRNSSRSGILVLPRKIRERIWRLVLVKPHNIVVCGCRYCLRLGDFYTPLTQVSRSIRAETLTIFYGDNRFITPIGHDTSKSIYAWLLAMGIDCRSSIRHLEMPSLDIRTTATNMADICQMELATNLAYQRPATWNDEDRLVSWPIFRARIPDMDNRSLVPARPAIPSYLARRTVSQSSLEKDYPAPATARQIIRHLNLPVIRITLPSGLEMDPPADTWNTADRDLQGRSSQQECDYTEAGRSFITSKLKAMRHSSRWWIRRG
ncbi:hypothetical protein AMS68_007750 [Peltaster fructicola]|uniref:Uncharacterized protein n=1 Tax=Peltaster fructicola TaxID=286661 RepID=A0A6H0Y5F8_9PEZI|nr:hypothetical protein AMS68_007750 [Peltaster fructicola]